ncbi:hypothetical protein [Phaeocystidibacter luteus]|uniref:YARHG domain-containing protein n=1 Tax=Phaeocystidibacter luteus TaxID=911197 RepID=A0A6N6RJQ8_9FLAO|nr:hypothetical protein [Phaeocystidibacter luteus]KAB2807722.1 hypothetical protein F8C67_11825 [Phaeocystidibacter luteus]
MKLLLPLVFCSTIAFAQSNPRVYVTDTSLYHQSLIDHWLELNPNSLYISHDTIVVDGHVNSPILLPTDLPLNEEVHYKGAKGDTLFQMLITRQNYTTLEYHMHGSIHGDVYFIRQGTAVINPAFYFGFESIYNDEEGNAFGMIRYDVQDIEFSASLVLPMGTDELMEYRESMDGYSFNLRFVNPAYQKSTEQFSCKEFRFASAQEHADTLLFLMQRIQNSGGKAKMKWEQAFFCAFPSSFHEMIGLFGIDDIRGPGPLYDFQVGGPVLRQFNQLATIPDSTFFHKYISICVEGEYHADLIQGGFGIATRIQSKPEAFVKALSSIPDYKRLSVFKYIFDGPAPDNETNQAILKALDEAIRPHSEREADILNQAYREVVEKWK